MVASNLSTPIDNRGVWVMRTTWLTIAFASIVFFSATAWAYYQVLLTQPFVGSTVQPSVIDLDAVRLGLGKYGLSLEAYAAILVLSQVIITLTSGVLGALIFWRRSNEPVAWVMSLVLVLMGALIPVQAYALVDLYPNLGFLAFATNQIGTIVNFVLIWIFPNGRFVPSWTRWTFLFTCVVGVYATAFPDTPLGSLIVPLALFLIVSGLVAQGYRYRRVSGPIERQQTKFVVIALAVAPLAWVVSALLLPSIFPMLTQTSENAAPYNLLRLSIGNLATLLVPLAIGLSILRYRLFDIDLIIRRTLIYSVLTTMLILFYFGSVAVLQNLLAVLSGQRSEIAIIISTLAIAALFNPLRHRVQNIIDHRFYRRKYDAHLVLARFAQSARDEVELEKLTGELVNVVNETMQPASVSLWLKRTEGTNPK